MHSEKILIRTFKIDGAALVALFSGTICDKVRIFFLFHTSQREEFIPTAKNSIMLLFKQWNMCNLLIEIRCSFIRCEKIKKDLTSKIIYFLHVYLHFYSYRKLNLKILLSIHTILSLHTIKLSCLSNPFLFFHIETNKLPDFRFFTHDLSIIRSIWTLLNGAIWVNKAFEWLFIYKS